MHLILVANEHIGSYGEVLTCLAILCSYIFSYNTHHLQQWYKYYCSTANLSDDNDQKLFVLVNVASQQAMVNKGSDPYTKVR